MTNARSPVAPNVSLSSTVATALPLLVPPPTLANGTFRLSSVTNTSFLLCVSTDPTVGSDVDTSEFCIVRPLAVRARNDAERAVPIDGAVMLKCVPFSVAAPPTSTVGFTPGPIAKSIVEPGVDVRLPPSTSDGGVVRRSDGADATASCAGEDDTCDVLGAGTAKSDPEFDTEPAMNPLARSVVPGATLMVPPNWPLSDSAP